MHKYGTMTITYSKLGIKIPATIEARESYRRVEKSGGSKPRAVRNMYARIVRWFPDQTVLKQKGKTRGEEEQHAKGLKCRDRRHIGHNMGKIHEEEQRWEAREWRRKRISSLLWWEERKRRLYDGTKGEGGRIRDIFIWHATRLHPSFINWRSQEWAWQTAPGQTYMYAPHIFCPSPPRPRIPKPLCPQLLFPSSLFCFSRKRQMRICHFSDIWAFKFVSI